MKKLLVGLWLVLGIYSAFTVLSNSPITVEAQSEVAKSEKAQIFMFGRDDCGFCQKQFEFLEAEGLPYTYYNIRKDEAAAKLYDAVTAKHGLSKVTPITVVGEDVFTGFNGPQTTGARIKEALDKAQSSPIRSVEDHLSLATVQQPTFEGGCTGIKCEEGSSTANFVFDLPILGMVDFRSFSLFSLSVILGVIDGFNPCAMWVLITFLVLLSQAGSRKKMIFLAGIFILAEGIMYNLILNVWYKTWDFVKLDEIITPLVGTLAIGGGLFFLWRWHKGKKTELVCDITDIETQSKTINKFKKIVEQPITLASIAAILVIAFSVNIIEFACSIGIPQAYTKILELNALGYFDRQMYILVYSLSYMFDDVIVFALAIWGYSKLQSHGGKYAQWSLLIGGILILLLGLILILNPELLVL